MKYLNEPVPQKGENSYSIVLVLFQNSPMMKLVHKLAALVFHPDSFFHGKHNVVDHVNQDRDDNFTGNLRWCTQKQNVEFAFGKKVYYQDVSDPNFNIISPFIAETGRILRVKHLSSSY